MTRRKLVVAIDGPAGAGKSTVARGVATRLQYLHIDSGAMYRAVALKTLRAGLSPHSRTAVADVARKARIELSLEANGEQNHVWLDGENVTELIRLGNVDEIVSIVATNPAVRDHLRLAQQELAAPGGVVMDGRDIGTVVLPDADVKVFLTASLAERAARRHAQLQEQGVTASLAQLQEEIARRDAADRQRAVAPLRRADDAWLLDSSDLSAAQTVERIVDFCRSKV